MAKLTLKKVYYGNCHDVEGIEMYYVIQVAPGREMETEKYIMERVPNELYFSCFHPVRHMRKKIHGEWKDVYEKLLPGYVFICSDRIQEVYIRLRKIPILTKLLGWDTEFVAALTDYETEWLNKIISVDIDGNRKAGVSLSQVEVDENDKIRILSGPLKNVAGMVKRINLHKRIAIVEVEFMGKRTDIYLGIEMIQKK